MLSFIIVQMVMVRCISRSHRLKKIFGPLRGTEKATSGRFYDLNNKIHQFAMNGFLCNSKGMVWRMRVCRIWVYKIQYDSTRLFGRFDGVDEGGHGSGL